jgi:large subunit ribosomal protein L28
MSRVCDICGKGPLTGSRISRRGKPKKAGGVGSRVVKRTRRRQLPNLQTVRASLNGRVVRLRVCAKCLKAGRAERRDA